jgi:DNA-binding MarR family transcriptional regulator
MTEPLSVDDIVLPALLRAARTTYGSAIRKAVVDAGFEDLPRNGAFVIGAISRSAPLATIIRGLGVSKQAAGQLVDTLVLRGYLLRREDAQDRRKLTVSLTSAGAEAAGIIRKATASVDVKLKKRMGEKSVAEARKVLFALIAIGQEGKDA